MKPSSSDPTPEPKLSLRPDGSPRPEGFAQMETGKVFLRPISASEESNVGGHAQLLLLTGTNAGQVFSLDRTLTEFVVGRGQDALVCIEDVEASRAHCKITVVGDGKAKRYVIEDLRSKNGTYVNAQPIVNPTDLTPGDRVHIGPNLVLRFSVVDAAEDSLARQLYETSTRDALTKSYNRRYFVERLASELAFAQRHKTRLSIVLLDLDHFKQKNDKHGHMGGDAVLRAVSACVEKLVRTEDVFARYGGEEFILLVRGIGHENVHLIAERVRRAIERLKITFDGAYLPTTVSIGISSLDEFPVGASIDALITLADKRLYAAKSAGRNQVCSAGL
ncbi:MAG: diguanylate cyclase [Polyangiaceae bacterium]